MRKHGLTPARRIVLAMLSTTSVVAMLFGYHTSTAGAPAAAPATTVISGTSTSPATRAATGTGRTSSAAGTGSALGTGSATGTGTGSTTGTTAVPGDTVQTRYGPVQLRLAVSDGTITGVDVLQYPAGGHNQELSSYALPILIQETLDAQSADLDMVSGATYTSLGYQQSLQSALDQAGM